MAIDLNETLSREEVTTAQEAIKRIIEQPVEELSIDSSIPTIIDCSDSNKVFKGQLSILFVDIRKSTDLADNTDPKTMVKVYRAFMRLALQCVRYNGGFTRQFAGDGIMGVFADDGEDETMSASQEKAVTAARQIITLIDFCLNPMLDSHFSDMRIGCGIGICTGKVTITKVGMRGREVDDTAENEMSIVWAGRATNYASKYCGLAQSGEIFIDEEILSELSEKTKWKKVIRTKGDKLYEGFIWINAYYDLPKGFPLEPHQAEIDAPKELFAQRVMEELRHEAKKMLDDIATKASGLSAAIAATEQERQNAVSAKSSAEKERKRIRAEKYKNEYNVIKGFFASMWCKNDAIKASGYKFWQRMLDRAYECASECDIAKEDVVKDFAMYLNVIYFLFERYEAAYDMYCCHARYDSWICYNDIEKMIEKTEHWALLSGIVQERINEDGSFEKAAAILKKMDRWK